jgi:transposase InsO family protein
VRELIAAMSRDNPIWGAERIRGELLKLGLVVGNRSIRRDRRRPLRPPGRAWRTFRHNHRPRIRAADLFTVQTPTFRTPYVLLFITHDRRELVHPAVTAHPVAAWIGRQLIEATPWGRQPRYLVRDRDRVYGGDFVARARGLGVETLLTPVRAPRANAIAERVVRTLRNECLDHVIVLSEAHLRAVLHEFVGYYNAERPHRGLQLDPPLARASPPRASGGPIRAHPVLGGLHHVYERAA